MPLMDFNRRTYTTLAPETPGVMDALRKAIEAHGPVETWEDARVLFGEAVRAARRDAPHVVIEGLSLTARIGFAIREDFHNRIVHSYPEFERPRRDGLTEVRERILAAILTEIRDSVREALTGFLGGTEVEKHAVVGEAVLGGGLAIRVLVQPVAPMGTIRVEVARV